LYFSLHRVLALVLAPTGASKRRKILHRLPPEQNLLIVTVMSFDRAGNIKHNHHVRHVQTQHVQTQPVQTRLNTSRLGQFSRPPLSDIARAGLPVLRLRLSAKDSLEFVI
jgi:hypothetical protein